MHCCLNTYYGENAKTQRIHYQHYQIVNFFVFKKETVYGRDKYYNRNGKSDYSVNRVVEGCRWSNAENYVSYNTAADGSYYAERCYTKYIHSLGYSDNGTRCGKCYRAYQLKYKNHCI